MYIEEHTSVWKVTQRHNCDVRKDSDELNHTIPESRDLIGQYLF